MIDFENYLKYLKSIKNQLPDHLYEFAKDVNRHNLTSPHSLHDSWITSITIKENRNNERPFEQKLTIEIDLLGPMHDREIILVYRDVESYEFNGKKNLLNFNDTFHGDVDRHEIRMSNDLFEHTIWLKSDSILTLKFRGFELKENMHSK